MRLINLYSRRGLVNILAEKISKKISENEKHKTIIEVTDCVNFLVVKGITSSNTLFDFTTFKKEFLETEKEFLEKLGIKNLNIIDIIQYDSVYEDEYRPYWFNFWKSDRPIYNQKVIDFNNKEKIYYESQLESLSYTDRIELELSTHFENNGDVITLLPLSVTSEFPFGYSMECGKSYLYYCEYICNQLFGVLNTDKILFKYSNERNINDDLSISIESNSQYSDSDVRSMVLDIFDFNIAKFQKDYLENYDFTEEIKNPTSKKPWILRDKVSEMVFV